MPAPIFSRRVQRDLRRIRSHVASESGRGRADELIDRILTVCALFAEQPGAGRSHPEFVEAVRSGACGLYLVFYRPRGGFIEVLRVIHGRRDIPSAWTEPDSHR